MIAPPTAVALLPADAIAQARFDALDGYEFENAVQALRRWHLERNEAARHRNAAAKPEMAGTWCAAIYASVALSAETAAAGWFATGVNAARALPADERDVVVSSFALHVAALELPAVDGVQAINTIAAVLSPVRSYAS